MEPLLRFSGGDEYRVEGDRERRRLEGGKGSLAVEEAAGDWGMSAVEMSHNLFKFCECSFLHQFLNHEGWSLFSELLSYHAITREP